MAPDSSILPAPTQDIFIGRQPIFDAELNVTAYELLFRSGEENVARVVDQHLATLGVLNTTFTEFGLQQLVGDKQAFININRDYLLSENSPPLPQGSVVLEILENTEVDANVVAAVTALAKSGYTIALDDFEFSSEWEPLLPLADIIKIDVMQLGPSEIEQEMARFANLDVAFLAEKIETEAEFETLREQGFQLFQGYFLEAPKVIRGRKFSSNQINLLTLMEALQQPDVPIHKIEKLVSRDVALSYKLLRLINSVTVSLSRQVNSIQQAIVYLGLAEIRSWVALLLLSTVEDRPTSLISMALVRAKMCELLATEANLPNIDSFFALGLFSNLDALLQTPMQELLPELPLSTAIREGLLGGDCVMAQALACVKSCEQMTRPEAGFQNLDRHTLQTLYGQAIDWSLAVEAELHQI